MLAIENEADGNKTAQQVPRPSSSLLSSNFSEREMLILNQATGTESPLAPFGGFQSSTTEPGMWFNQCPTQGIYNADSKVAEYKSAPCTPASLIPHAEREGPLALYPSTVMSISVMRGYRRWSQEELRMKDYSDGRRFGPSTFRGFW